MYGFGEELTKENILKKITSYDIFRYYSENFKDIGKSFCSDLPGRTDENPSAQINVIKNDFIKAKFFPCFRDRTWAKTLGFLVIKRKYFFKL